MMIQIYSFSQWFKRATLSRKERFHSIRFCTKKCLKFSLHYFRSNIHFSKEIMLPSVYSSVKIYTRDVTLWCRKHIFILSWGNFSQLWYLISNNHSHPNGSMSGIPMEISFGLSLIVMITSLTFFLAKFFLLDKTSVPITKRVESLISIVYYEF